MPDNINDFLKQTYGISFYDEDSEDANYENCQIGIDWACVIFIGGIIAFTVILALILSI